MKSLRPICSLRVHSSRLVIPLVPLLLLLAIAGAVSAPASTNVYASLESMSNDELVRIYNQIEDVLLIRLNSVATNEITKVNAKEVTGLIKTIERVRSAKAIPPLLRLIDFSQDATQTPWGPDVLVTLGHPSYPAMNALRNMGGFTKTQCMDEMKRAKEGSLRELMLAQLGVWRFGDSFTAELKGMGEKQDRWSRLLLSLSGEKQEQRKPQEMQRQKQ
jgi:hypothetical protein